MWDNAKMRPVQKTMSFLLPHEILHNLIEPGKEGDWCDFQPGQAGFKAELKAWGGDKQQVDVESDPWACIALWGDSAPSTRKDSVHLLTFRLLNGSVRKRFWIACFSKKDMCKCGCYGRCTMQTMFEIVGWSMRALLAGKHPSVDHRGNRFPPGSPRGEMAGQTLRVRGAVLAKVGDWAWYKQALNLKYWRGEGEDLRLCWLYDGCLREGRHNYCYRVRWMQGGCRRE